MALALATATGAPARVVECCPPLASGFSAAANAELGTEGPWRRGSRGDVLLERPITGDDVQSRTASGEALRIFVAAAVRSTALPGARTEATISTLFSPASFVA